MPWVRIDDHYDEHPKIAAVGPLGQALWLAGLAYCNRNLTDGRIPWSLARSLLTWEFLEPPAEDGRQRRMTVGVTSGSSGDDVTCEYVIGLLLHEGLWEEVPGAYLVHDYPDYQPTKAEVMALREVKRTAGRAGGLARGKQRANHRAKQPAKHRAKQTAGSVLSKSPSKTQAKPKPVPVPVPVPNESRSPESAPPPLPSGVLVTTAVAAAEAAATNNDEKGGDVRQPHDGGTGPAQQPTGSLQQHLDDTGGRLVHPAKPEELAKPLAAKGVQV